MKILNKWIKPSKVYGKRIDKRSRTRDMLSLSFVKNDQHHKNCRSGTQPWSKSSHNSRVTELVTSKDKNTTSYSKHTIRFKRTLKLVKSTSQHGKVHVVDSKLTARTKRKSSKNSNMFKPSSLSRLSS